MANKPKKPAPIRSVPVASTTDAPTPVIVTDPGLDQTVETIPEAVVVSEPPVMEDPVPETHEPETTDAPINTMTQAIVAAPVPPAAPVVEETIQSYLLGRHKNLEKLSLNVQGVISRLESYISDMGPRTPINPVDGGMRQRELYNIYVTAIASEGGEHRLCLDAVTWFFHKHRQGCFSERLVYRFMDTARMLPADAANFQRLTHLFVSTADPATRRNNLRSRVRLQQILEGLPTLQMKQRLQDYYN